MDEANEESAPWSEASSDLTSTGEAGELVIAAARAQPSGEADKSKLVVGLVIVAVEF